MPQKVIKTTVLILFVFLFFFIINQFFRENKRLLEERNQWQEKAFLYAEQIDMAKQGNGWPAAGGEEESLPGVSIREVKITALTFAPGRRDRLNYSISLTVANDSPGRTEPAVCLLYFVALTPGGEIAGTTPRVIHVPALASGGRKDFLLHGGLDLKPGEELVLYVDLPAGAAGPVKKRITLREPFN